MKYDKLFEILNIYLNAVAINFISHNFFYFNHSFQPRCVKKSIRSSPKISGWFKYRYDRTKYDMKINAIKGIIAPP